MDYFCQQCAAKPGWEFDEKNSFRHACQRCFQHKPCNDYHYKTGRPKAYAAPKPKELVPNQVNAQAQVDLPRAKPAPAPTPVPVYEVDAPDSKPIANKEMEDCKPAEAAPVEPPAPVAAAPSAAVVDNRTEADKALDALQPNRPGVRLETRQGRPGTNPVAGNGKRQ